MEGGVWGRLHTWCDRSTPITRSHVERKVPSTALTCKGEAAVGSGQDERRASMMVRGDGERKPSMEAAKSGLVQGCVRGVAVCVGW